MYDRSDLIAFLRHIDDRLQKPGDLRLIGGSVLALAYDPLYVTHDLDYGWADREVFDAVQSVSRDYPKSVPASLTGVYFAPDDFEDRLERLQVPGLKRLNVWVPEKHDFVIMKIIRGYGKDVDAIVRLHAVESLSLRLLIKRFSDTWVTGPQSEADMKFHAAMEALFGEQEAEDAMRRLNRLRGR